MNIFTVATSLFAETGSRDLSSIISKFKTFTNEHIIVSLNYITAELCQFLIMPQKYGEIQERYLLINCKIGQSDFIWVFINSVLCLLLLVKWDGSPVVIEEN